MANALIKDYANKLIQPPDVVEVISGYSYFKPDTEARLTTAAYTSFKYGLYGGADFEYELSHTSWGGAASTTFDAYGNLIESSYGWYIYFFTPIGGTPPDSQKIDDSDVDTPLGGETVYVAPQTKSYTPNPYYESVNIIGWNGSAVSNESTNDICLVEFQISVSSQGVVCGINDKDKAANISGYSDILYAVYAYGGFFRLINNGEIIGAFSQSTYASTDVFKISLDDSEVIFYKNSTKLYTLTRSDSAKAFKLDASLYNSGDRIDNAVLTRTSIKEAVITGSQSYAGKGFESNDVADGSGLQSYSGLGVGEGASFEQAYISGSQSYTGKGFESNDVADGAGSQSYSGLGIGEGASFEQAYAIGSQSYTGKGFESNNVADISGTQSYSGYGDSGLLEPPDIAYSFGSQLYSGFASVDSGEMSAELLEPIPTLDTNGVIINKGLVVSRNFLCTFTGSADGLDDIQIPISSISATLSNAGTSSMQVVVPDGVTYGSEIASRSNGGFIITSIENYTDGTTAQTDIGEFLISNISPNQGARSYSVSVSGELKLSRIGGNTLSITGQSQLNSSNGKRRVRCDLDKDLQPADTVISQFGGSFVVGRISWTISATGQYMDLTEA